MEYTLAKNSISISVLDKGAELRSLKLNDVEYMWGADPRFWGKTSPVLFPFIGGLKNDAFFYKGNAYQGTKHGFARDNVFELVNQTEDSFTFVFKSNAQTLQHYPFRFELFIIYQIKAQGLEIQYKVVNVDEKEMFFSIGAHPAFALPTSEDIDIEDYYLEFEKEEQAPCLQLEGLLVKKELGKGIEGKILPLAKDTFSRDVLIFENLKSDYVILKCKKSTRAIQVDFAGFPYLGFWNIPNAAFICIEPWYGIADFIDTTSNLEEKKGIQILAPKGNFEAAINIKLDN